MSGSAPPRSQLPLKETPASRAAQQHYRYDVFICYSKTDATWVWDWLLPRLQVAGLTVCIDDESFEPGAPVADEIERAVRESRHTLAVLSPGWVDGEWSRFESLLVNRQDPNARWRRLIPLLLEPCAPPDRIRLLNWVDLSDPDKRDGQVERVVDAIRGRRTLPELRPDTFPEPRQRRLELRWYAVAGVATLATLAVLVAWIVLQRGPTSMPTGDFNIAVAEFRALDGSGQPVKNAAAAERAQSVASFLQSQADVLYQVLDHKVNVWGPEHHIGPLAPGDESRRAEALNAQVLVHGLLRATGEGRWSYEPAFYLQDTAIGNAVELAGEHALGAPIGYRESSTASEGDVNKTMAVRLRALAQLLKGLSYYEGGSRDDYHKAAETFREAAADPDWGSAASGTGQEVLYLFLGNALLKESAFLHDDPAGQATLLDESKAAFRRAAELNPGYARAYNGLGYALIQSALPTDPVANECGWDWQAISEAESAFTRALTAPASAKPQSGYVDLRANIGLAEVYFWQSKCPPQPERLGLIQQHLSAAQQAFDALPPVSQGLLRSEAARMHTYLGHMADTPAEAAKHYAEVVALGEKSGTENLLAQARSVMPWLLTVYCLDAENTKASSALDQFVARLPSPDAARKEILDQLAPDLRSACLP